MGFEGLRKTFKKFLCSLD